MAGCGAHTTRPASSQDVAAGSPVVTSVSNGALPAPSMVDTHVDARPYMIGPFDKLSVDVFGVDNLSRQSIQVDSSGRLAYPLIGEVNVLGKTPIEVARLIADGLRGRYLRDPQVTVNLVEAVSQIVTVDGQVNQPGLYPVIGKMTLLRAIATAKGVSEFAKLTDVIVFRTVNGQRMAGAYNLKAIRRGTYDDPEVFAGDVIVVGDSPSRRLFHDILQAAPLLSLPLTLILR